MAQPFDYGVNIPDPAQAFKQAYEMGTVITNQRLAQEEAQKKQLLQTELANLYKNPNASATDYARVAAFLPQAQAAIVTQGFERKTKEQQQTDLLMGGQVYSAIKAGRLDIAEIRLTEKATALRNSGRENEAKAAENALELIKIKPELAQTTIGLYMAKLPGGTEYLTNADKALAIIRAEAEAPAKLSELQAKAISAGVAAEFARPVAIAELAKTKAETLAPSVRESIDFSNLSPGQQITFQALQILKKPPAAVTNVNVSTVDKTAAAELGKLVPDLYNQANSAATQLSDLPRYKIALDNAITGPFAEQRLSTVRVASALGFTGDKAVNATRELLQGLSEMALKSRSMMTGQGAITEGEQKLLIQARSGDINFTKGEIKLILNVAERAAKSQYDQSNKLLRSAATQSPTAQMFLDNVQQLPPETPAPLPASATIKGKTYSRPETFSDLQWRNYLIAEGVIK